MRAILFAGLILSSMGLPVTDPGGTGNPRTQSVQPAGIDADRSPRVRPPAEGFPVRIYSDAPVRNIPIDPRVHGTEISRYRGSSYRCDRDVLMPVGTDVQDAIATLLTMTDLIPTARSEYFAWCDRRPDIAVIGWGGIINSIVPTEDGWLVCVFVSPKIARVRAVAPATLDSFTEYYTFDRNLAFHFVGGEADPSAMPGSIVEY